MIAIPAVDLRDGACVQLVGGSFSDERVRLPDPIDVARCWADAGFRQLHVVDLDAAAGESSNASTVDALLEHRTAEVQVGGGVRSTDRIERLLEGGAARVIVGTRAIEDEAWLCEVTAAYPGRLIVAADVRDRTVVTRGWASQTGRDISDVLAELAGIPIAGILVTAIHVEGQMCGPDLPLMRQVVLGIDAPVIASGGVTTLDDLYALEASGVAASVIGMALYTGALDARVVAREFYQ